MKKLGFVDLRGFLRLLILHELSKRPLCGDDLAEIVGKKKGSKLTPGTIYPVLKKFKKAKLVDIKKQGRKKLYHLTEEGKNEYKNSRVYIKKIFGDMF